ncbi:hypothetical protein ACSBR1_039930 [Camellia fascicularis]
MGQVVSDLIYDFKDRNKLVGAVEEPLSALYDGIGIHHYDNDAFYGLAALHHHSIFRRIDTVPKLVWGGYFLLHNVASKCYTKTRSFFCHFFVCV